MCCELRGIGYVLYAYVAVTTYGFLRGVIYVPLLRGLAAYVALHGVNHVAFAERLRYVLSPTPPDYV